jgi:ferredoxin
MPRIDINLETCIGAACCRAEAPSTFDVMDNKSEVIDPNGDPLAVILEAARRCPTQSISIFDDGGNRLWPK